jgi:predicted enzyme related to lactoylglutathione lyase
MDLVLFRIEIFSKQPYVLKDFYEQVLELPVTYASADGNSFELGSARVQIVISKSLYDVKNKIRVCFNTSEFKSYKQLLVQKGAVVTATKVKEGRFFFEMKDPDGNEVAVYQV